MALLLDGYANCDACRLRKPRAPGGYLYVCAHVTSDGAPCRDPDVAAGVLPLKPLYVTIDAQRRRNLDELLVAVETWPGEPAAYDLGS